MGIDVYLRWPGQTAEELLDRLTHRCHILEAKGESFRLRDDRRRQRRASGSS
jgi:DNA replication protein DnaC